MLVTHVFDEASPYLDSDAVFAVKPTLLRRFVRHEDGADAPGGARSTGWWEVRSDITLARGESGAPVADPGRTA